MWIAFYAARSRHEDRDLHARRFEPDDRDGRGDDQQCDQEQHDAEIRITEERHQQHTRAVAGGVAFCLLVEFAYQNLQFFLGHSRSLPVPDGFLSTSA
jgi:hypothetical protein